METPRRAVQVLFFFLLLTIAGCLPPGQGGKAIGTLRVSGPNVWLNNSQGRDGDTVFAGSTVATGEGSSALVEFQGGGYLQIDENTDPLFDWLAQSRCILIRLIRGQAYLKRERACVEGPNIGLILNSEANIRLDREPNLSEVTLLQGSADVSRPASIRLVPGEQFIVSGRQIAALRHLTPAQLRAVIAWRGHYRFRPLPAPESEGGFRIPLPDRSREPGRTTTPPVRTVPPSAPPAPSAPSAPQIRRSPPTYRSPDQYRTIEPAVPTTTQPVIR